MPDPKSSQNGPAGNTASAPAPAGKTASALATKMKQYDIPKFVQDHYPDLISLTIESESMNDDERQYWFSILPIMTEEQVQKLREILLNEREQLRKLDEEYAKELKKINDDQIIQMQEAERKEKWGGIRESEKTHETQEAAQEEELLKKLQEL